ncbi:MAG: nitronate monooxygenase [Oscillospiraceae bacterium]|jgi:enoyl-[acyl-carrier protein] reductase II|nr:nitronate monooxygenase [Oscillospiraceae bacterium]
MINSPICGLLGIEHPIIQGGMAWVSDGTLAAAVSNGGGLGIISAMSADAGYLSRQVARARSLTDRPFGVNVMLMSPYAGEVARTVADMGVSVVTTGAGNPSKYMKMWIDSGVAVIPVVASVALARMMERSGASAVIAEGGESGGHVGDTSTLVLVPQVCDAVGIPVIAAGGIADGRGFAAVRALGACGVQIGTRFLVADECSIHDNYKDKIIKASDIATVVTGRRLGHAVRSLKTPFSRAYLKAEYDSALPDEDLEKLGVGALRLAAVEGDAEHGCFLAGQVAGMVKKRQRAADIISEIMAEAEVVIKGASEWAV